MWKIDFRYYLREACFTSIHSYGGGKTIQLSKGRYNFIFGSKVWSMDINMVKGYLTLRHFSFYIKLSRYLFIKVKYYSLYLVHI